MKNRAKLLGVRPFNMANFSSGSGVLIWFAMLGWVFSFPALLILWTGMALPLMEKGGRLNYQILKKRLNIIVLPICLAAFVFFFCSWAFYGSYGISMYTYGLAIIWISAFYTIGIYCCLLFSARMLNAANKLFKGRWLLWTVLFYATLVAVGILISIVFVSLGPP